MQLIAYVAYILIAKYTLLSRFLLESICMYIMTLDSRGEQLLLALLPLSTAAFCRLVFSDHIYMCRSNRLNK